MNNNDGRVWPSGYHKKRTRQENPKPLIVPATQRNENRNLEYREGDILGQYEIGEKLAHTENGGQGTVYRARRKEDGLDVVLKIYSAAEKPGDWDEILHEEKRAGREIRFLERANRDGIKGLPTLVQYGTTGSFIKTPVAVFEPLPGRTLEDEVLDPNYTPVLEKALAIMKGLSEPLQYAHESNGVKPVVHRDINPGNIMINGEPILMDWATSTNPSTGRTLLRTQMYTQHFTAPEVTEGKDFDSRADIYSLGKVAQFVLLGKEFIEAEGQPTKQDFENMNIPGKVIAVLERATNENPEQRYRTVREFYQELGISLEGGLPARIESSKEFPETIDYSRELVINGIRFPMGENVYDTLKIARKKISETLVDHSDDYHIGKGMSPAQTSLANKLTLAYLQYEAEAYPILQDVIEGKQSLEGILREKKPSTIQHFLENAVQSSERGLHRLTLPIPDEREYQLSKQQYYQRRAKLLKVFGIDKRNLSGDVGLIAGLTLNGVFGSAGTMAALASLTYSHLFTSGEFAAWILGNASLGAIVGSNIERYTKKRKLLRQAREMDSWIREARASQGPERRVKKLWPNEKYDLKGNEDILKKNYITSEGEILTDGTKVPYSKGLPIGDTIRRGGGKIQN